MNGSLATTNVLVAVIMAMIVVQTMLIVGAGVAAFGLYRRISRLIDGIDPHAVRQTVTKASAILDEVQTVLTRVDREVERVEAVFQSTVNVAEAVGSGVRAKSRWLVGAGRGLGVLVSELLKPRSRQRT